jgi:hypothetical protein
MEGYYDEEEAFVDLGDLQEELKLAPGGFTSNF